MCVYESKVTHARQKTSMLISTSLLDVYRLPDISNVQVLIATLTRFLSGLFFMVCRSSDKPQFGSRAAANIENSKQADK